METNKLIIEKLRSIANELENELKSKFEIGEYVEWSGHNPGFGFIIGKCESFDDSYKVHFCNSESKVNPEKTSCNYKHLRKLTQKEVEEALTKEAVKRGFKINTRISGFWGTDIKEILGDYKFELYESVGKHHFKLGDRCIFLDGTWSTPIKTKTIDELANILKFSDGCFISDYFKDNKQEIIETLNNL